MTNEAKRAFRQALRPLGLALALLLFALILLLIGCDQGQPRLQPQW